MRPTKRAFDLFWVTLGLAGLWPLLAVVAAAIWATDPGPIFFRQTRVGHRGRPFRIFKFRTMVVDAEAMGAKITAGGDPRITPLGRILRKTKLDELPQLFNVFAGEMSLVGPRPEVQEYVDLYTPEQRQVLELVPGITDLASIEFRNEEDLLAASDDPRRTYVEEIMPEKIRLNLEYARTASVFNDFRIILATLFKVSAG